MTIKFKHGSFVIEDDGSETEDDGDEPYVLVFINGKQEYRSSPSLSSCFQCDFNVAFESDLIDKNSIISIEVMDEDRGQDALFNPDDLIINRKEINGTVDDFLKKGMFFLRNHQDPKSKMFNYIETISFWTDEYEVKPIADVFL